VTAVTHEAKPTFDPFTEGFFDDPYPHYAQLREHNPVHSTTAGITLCFGFEDVRRILIDPRSTSMDRVRALSGHGGKEVVAPPTFPLSLLNQDPPEHSRLRRLMSPSFSQRQLEAHVAWMERRVDELLDDLQAEQRDTGGPVDLIRGLAFPFPFSVISHLLGMPDGDDEQVREWAHEISAASDPIVAREHVLRSVETYTTMLAYFEEEVLPWKAQHPGDDLLTSMMAAEAEGTLTRDELVDNVALLYVAGHETTSGLIGNGVLNLLRHPAQLELLRSRPDLLPNAVDELNRFESSIQFAWRYVIEDLDLGEHTLAPGTMAFVSCGAANRDPDHFGETADELDLTREDARDLLSFGAGMHFCLGAHLARREVALVLGRLLARAPGLELGGEWTWNQGMTFRQLRTLPVALG
jgi:cytochrome P450